MGKTRAESEVYGTTSLKRGGVKACFVSGMWKELRLKLMGSVTPEMDDEYLQIQLTEQLEHAKRMDL